MKSLNIVLILFLAIFLAGNYMKSETKTTIEKVPCYDNHYNQINQLTCDKEVVINKTYEIASSILFVLGGAGCLCILFKILVDYLNKYH